MDAVTLLSVHPWHTGTLALPADYRPGWHLGLTEHSICQLAHACCACGTSLHSGHGIRRPAFRVSRFSLPRINGYVSIYFWRRTLPFNPLLRLQICFLRA
ncbi:hypothetical protein M405DRAFT_491707 [Rhizopogon salebrosus TDB-379]|nr:hypothetical protein M405DRAFT_491707 [Rhizopogon salebrosus TDB-379]